jgi:formylglycine-generating enzyme required for sulfatase activity
MESPRCFISYSWDNEQHREWVRKLATRLRECGVDAILDQFHCAPGTDLTQFMEKSVRESSFVLLVCTPNFARKADSRVGGVGYEKQIITGEMFSAEVRETKFVPVLREGDAKESLPSYLKSRLFIDLREDGSFEAKLEELLRHFHGEPLYSPPPLGTKPDWTKPKESPPIKKHTVSKPTKKSTASVPAQKPPLQQAIQNTIGMEFVLIPAGSFMMGSHISPEEVTRKFGGDTEWYECEHPQHKVTISEEFYLQVTEVTQSQWKKVMKDNPSEFKDCEDYCPAEKVSWYDAKKFIKKLNEIEKTDKYRLPTEAEWEYACRAGTTTNFSFGDDASKLVKYGWYSDNSEARTHPVRTKEPNPWGLYDMHGNIMEWVEDDWHKTYDGAPADGSGWLDKNNDTALVRAICGGSWFDSASACRSTSRGFNASNERDYDIGFRLAMSVALGS